MFNSFIHSEFISLLYLVVHLTAVATVSDVVETKQGRVKGIRQEVQVENNQTKIVYKFLGVPYAQKPIEDLRFKPPQALCNRNSSDYNYNATSLRPICMQDDYYFDSIREAWPEFDPKRDMSEDCLYLNIYTPSTNGTRKYPVIVHIHGGSYLSGSPTRDTSPGEYLPTRDVVLVTIQYRLQTFGFFTTGDSEAPGNVGLRDQVQALKWIQQNIESFGGDKNSVTLLGESAGGSSVGLHYLSPMSKGLFHRGIAVSGVDLSQFAYTQKSWVLEASNDFVEKVNCTKQSSRETLRCLRSLPSSTILANPKFWLMQPFVDQPFLPDEAKTLRKEGRFHKLPFMSGFTSQDGSFFIELSIKSYTTPDLKKYLEEYFEQRIEYTKDEAKDAFTAIVSKYNLDIDDSRNLRQNLIEMISDHLFTAPTDAALRSQSDEGAATFMFEFAHRSRYHPRPKWAGVVHEDTTAYTFGLPFLNSKSNLKFDDDDKEVSDMLVTMFTNFAKFGNPTPSPVHGVEWDTFDSSNKAYLKIQKNPVMKNSYRPGRMKFWNTEFPPLLPKRSKKESISSDFVNNRGKPKFYRIHW